MNLVVDASVMVKWFVQEDGRDAARRVLDTANQCTAPDLASLEVAGALDKKVKERAIDLDRAVAAIGALRRDLDFRPAGMLVEPAMWLANVLGHPVADCVYLACAIERDGRLVTADVAFTRKVANTGYASRILALGDMPLSI